MNEKEKDKRFLFPPETTAKDIAEVGTMAADWFEDGTRIIVLRGPTCFCSYLGIAKDHPLANHDYDDLPIDCHGGLTYAGEGLRGAPEGYFWYGYDYGHCDDYSHMPKISGIVKLRGKDWTLDEVVTDAWGAVYDFKRLLKISERISRSPTPPDALVDRLAGLLRQAQGKITHRDMPLYTEIESALEIYRAGYQTAVPKIDDALVEAVELILSGDSDKWVEYADSNGIERERIKGDYCLLMEFENDARYAYPARDKLKRLILEHALNAHKKAVR